MVESHRAVAVPKCHRLPGFKAYNIWGFYNTASALSPSDYKVVTVVAKISGCNSLLHICGRSSSWRRALHLFQSLPEGSLQQTVQSIGAITAAFSQVGLLGGLNPRSDAWIQVANIPFRRLVPNLSHGMLDLVDSHSTDAQLVWSTFYPYMKYYTSAFFFQTTRRTAMNGTSSALQLPLSIFGRNLLEILLPAQAAMWKHATLANLAPKLVSSTSALVKLPITFPS